MSDDLRWLLALIIGSIGTLAAIVISHIISDAAHRERTAKLETSKEQHEKEISGLRKKFHELVDKLGEMRARLFFQTHPQSHKNEREEQPDDET